MVITGGWVDLVIGVCLFGVVVTIILAFLPEKRREFDEPLLEDRVAGIERMLIFVQREIENLGYDDRLGDESMSDALSKVFAIDSELKKQVKALDDLKWLLYMRESELSRSCVGEDTRSFVA